MPRMMRTTLVFVCSLIVGCSSADDGDGTGGGGVDAAVGTAAVCGDGVCMSIEVGSCTSDCGAGGGGNTNPTCGNATCENGETAASCPNDCGGGGGGSGSGSTTCPSDPLECLLCAVDPSLCPTGLDQAACAACVGGGGLPGGGSGTGCTGGAPDGTCDANENSTTCPFDCM